MASVIWPAELQLASHVFLAYVDISSAGLRALMLLRKAWSDQSFDLRNYKGKIVAGNVEMSKAWKECSEIEGSDDPLEICTLFDKDQVPMYSILFVNTVLPVEIVTGVGSDLIEGFTLRKVNTI